MPRTLSDEPIKHLKQGTQAAEPTGLIRVIWTIRVLKKTAARVLKKQLFVFIREIRVSFTESFPLHVFLGFGIHARLCGVGDEVAAFPHLKLMLCSILRFAERDA